VNEGKLEPEQMTDIISGRDRRLAGRSVPAEGLFLWKVDYPNKIFINKG
jgi:tRNA pseudouridine38-40 synthase